MKTINFLLKVFGIICITIGIVGIIILSFGCKPREIITKTERIHDTIHIEKMSIKYDTIKISNDQTWIKALIKCDSNHQAYIKSIIEYKPGKRIIPNINITTDKTGQNIIEFNCKEDSLKQVITTIQSQIYDKVTNINNTEKKKQLTGWQKFINKSKGYIIGIIGLIIGFIIGCIFYKLYIKLRIKLL